MFLLLILLAKGFRRLAEQVCNVLSIQLGSNPGEPVVDVLRLGTKVPGGSRSRDEVPGIPGICGK